MGEARVGFDPRLHPISLVMEAIGRLAGSIVLEFSRYDYKPRSVDDDREIFQVPAADLSPKWLQQELANLSESQELALDSRVLIDGRLHHFRMVDFDHLTTDELKSLDRVLDSKEASAFRYYFSGRSFHAYSPELLHGQEEWVGFMGRLLLSNFPGKPRVIDSRWVGHRLIAGYSALRWSANTRRHLQIPEEVNLEELKTATVIRRIRRVAGQSRKISQGLDSEG